MQIKLVHIAIKCAAFLKVDALSSKYCMRLPHTTSQNTLINSLCSSRHNDIPWQLRKYYMNRLENVTLDKNNPKFHTDIPRLKQGGVGAQVRVEKQDCGRNRRNWTDDNRRNVVLVFAINARALFFPYSYFNVNKLSLIFKLLQS